MNLKEQIQFDVLRNVEDNLLRIVGSDVGGNVKGAVWTKVSINIRDNVLTNVRDNVRGNVSHKRNFDII